MSNKIIRFDHISYVSSRSEYVPEEGYKFSEIKKDNTKGRYLFMDTPFPDIDMYFYDRSMPVEAVIYDKVTGFSDVKVTDNIIECKIDAKRKSEIDRFFCKLGFKPEEDKWLISGTLDKNKNYLKYTCVDECKTIPINHKGYNCPCFLVISVKDLFSDMRSLDGVFVSEVNPLLINGRNLDIGFMKIEGFELAFEFISISRQNR